MSNEPTDIDRAREKRRVREQAEDTVDELDASLDRWLVSFRAAEAAADPIDPSALAGALAAARQLVEAFVEAVEESGDDRARETFEAGVARARDAERYLRSLPLDDEQVEEATTALYHKVEAARGHDDPLTWLLYGSLSAGGPMAQLSAMEAYYALKRETRRRIEDGSDVQRRAAEQEPSSNFWSTWSELDYAIQNYRRALAEGGVDLPAPLALLQFFTATRWRTSPEWRPLARLRSIGSDETAGAEQSDEEQFIAFARGLYRAATRNDPSGDPNVLLRTEGDAT